MAQARGDERELIVVGQDPGYGGGGRAQMEAFLEAARALGSDPELVFVPHPSLRPGPHTSHLDRVETLRILRGSKRLVSRLRTARHVWVVSTLAYHGYAAALAARPYSCWLGTSLADESRGRVRGLPRSRRFAALVNRPGLTRLERSVVDRAQRVFATSPASRSAIARAVETDPARIDILPIPVDTKRFAPQPEAAWLEQLRRPVLVFVGRTDDPRKNLRLALATISHVRRRIPGATLRVIGPGSRVDPLPDGVEYVGEVADVADRLSECTLLLLPARQEGFGIVAAEALAAGVPVVATPSGGPEDLLRRSGAGVVVERWEPEDLAEQVTSLLTRPDRLTEMRRAGRAYVLREHTPARLQELLEPALRSAELTRT